MVQRVLTPSTTDEFLAEQGRAFLVDRVVEQASNEQTPLSDVERRMLAFSERDAEPDFAALDAFNEKYNTEEFEERIAGLVHRAHEHDQEKGKAALWRQALRAVYGMDFYLLSIIRKWRLEPTFDVDGRRDKRGLVTVLLFALMLGLTISLAGRPDDDWVRILIAVAFAFVAPFLWRISNGTDPDS